MPKIETAPPARNAWKEKLQALKVNEHFDVETGDERQSVHGSARALKIRVRTMVRKDPNSQAVLGYRIWRIK